MKHLRKQILNMAFEAQSGHIPSAFSILDIIWILYNRILNVYPTTLKLSSRDIFILSKGQGCLALYVVLAERGFISDKDLTLFCKSGGILGGHPDATKIPGVEASTGSLGHGLPIGLGFALAAKIQAVERKTIVLVGDGECNEGSIWEAALLASHHKLKNLICIIDYNHSTDRALSIENPADKFKAFGWNIIEIDGHDHTEIERALKTDSINKPLAIIAHTIKGKGCQTLENNPAWHHRAPTELELKLLEEELE